MSATARQILQQFGHLAAEMDAIDSHIHALTQQISTRDHAIAALQTELAKSGRDLDTEKTAHAAARHRILELETKLYPFP